MFCSFHFLIFLPLFPFLEVAVSASCSFLTQRVGNSCAWAMKGDTAFVGASDQSKPFQLAQRAQVPFDSARISHLSGSELSTRIVPSFSASGIHPEPNGRQLPALNLPLGKMSEELPFKDTRRSDS